MKNEDENSGMKEKLAALAQQKVRFRLRFGTVSLAFVWDSARFCSVFLTFPAFSGSFSR